MRRVILALALVFGLHSVAAADGIDGVSLGQHWFGPKRSVEELKGRVVMFELWGYN